MRWRIESSRRSGPARPARQCCLRTTFAMLLLAASAQASAPEYQLKALFLFNFTQFIEWPAAALGPADAPMWICVLGEDPFGSYLDDAVMGESVRGHPLLTRRHSRVEESDGCHILFVSGSESARFERILGYLKGKSTLTVADAPGFMRAGGMIGLITVHNRIRLRINPQIARAAHLTISSKLLKPAELVSEE